ncbi:tripartite tricarboxylate transporter substrate binding protein [Delftia acidovorans]|uniref:Bug family tripartite tricarboxylate transporter substrate binding protein n=1 Tax=Delftia acidovorans TaxID=80866 RepID=UPI0018D965FD|nr:tripartite tricarboxylate transporter substrate binding protein [Delftia acidovorans]QPR33125.1 tripartite tricarboxylate transporter substrate binding protein [Delftia acidovorans]
MTSPRNRLAAAAVATLAATALCALSAPAAWAQWKPAKSVELVVPFSAGGASDQMARVIQAIVTKHKLIEQPVVILNKAGASGAEGILDVKASARDPHKLLVASTAIFTLPMATALPFQWRDLNPVAMIAQDQFVLWVNAETGYQTPADYLAAARQAGGKFKMGGTSSKREDQIITANMEQAAGVKFTYIPYKGGGEASTQLVGKHIDSNVNNPSESMAQWRAGQVRALCVFDTQRIEYTAKVTGSQALSDIPTCREQGLDVQYTMLRGFFLPPGTTPEQAQFYAGVMQKVVATPEWKEYLEKNALKPEYMTGQAFVDFLAKDETRHLDIMKKAGFLSASVAAAAAK